MVLTAITDSDPSNVGVFSRFEDIVTILIFYIKVYQLETVFQRILLLTPIPHMDYDASCTRLTHPPRRQWICNTGPWSSRSAVQCSSSLIFLINGNWLTASTRNILWSAGAFAICWIVSLLSQGTILRGSTGYHSLQTITLHNLSSHHGSFSSDTRHHQLKDAFMAISYLRRNTHALLPTVLPALKSAVFVELSAPMQRKVQTYLCPTN